MSIRFVEEQDSWQSRRMWATEPGELRASSGGASRLRLAEWERRAFTVLREHAELVTVVDDELPEEAWRDLDEMRSALDRFGTR